MNVLPIISLSSTKPTNIQAKIASQQGSVYYSNISFRGLEHFNDYQIKQLNESKNALNDVISSVFKIDRTIIDNSFIGEIDERDKFSKLGYYLSLNETENNELNQYLQNQNIRKLNKEYNDFYNTHLKSYSKVAKGQKKYLDDSINNSLKISDIDNSIKNKLDMFFTNKMEEVKQLNKINDETYLCSDFAQKKLREFVLLFKENPLRMSKNNLNFVFEIINKLLDSVDKNEYENIYNNLDSLSEALYENDKDLMLDSWKKLTNSTIEFYKKDYLRAVVNDKDEKVSKLNKFLQSNNYRTLNYGNKLSQLFEYRGSGELTLSEKVFLIDKYNQAEKDRKSYGIDMLDFLSARPANNKIRKQIVKNLMESQEFANDNFNDLKSIFVEDINHKNYDSNIFQQTINRMNIVDLVLEDMNIEHMFMSEKNKVDYLSTIADEDIEKSLEKLRKSWLEEKFVQTLNFESDKYDLPKQTDMLISKLTIKHNEKNIPINEFLDESFKAIYGQNADLTEISKKVLEYEKADNKNIQGLFIQNKVQYDALMSQFESVIKTLSANNANTEAYFMKISKELDKIEINCPWLKPQVKDTRSTMQKIRDGVFNSRTLMSSGFAFNALLSIASSLAKTGEPNLMTLGASLMFLCHITNAYYSYKNSYNYQGGRNA